MKGVPRFSTGTDVCLLHAYMLKNKIRERPRGHVVNVTCNIRGNWKYLVAWEILDGYFTNTISYPETALVEWERRYLESVEPYSSSNVRFSLGAFVAK